MSSEKGSTTGAHSSSHFDGVQRRNVQSRNSKSDAESVSVASSGTPYSGSIASSRMSDDNSDAMSSLAASTRNSARSGRSSTSGASGFSGLTTKSEIVDVERALERRMVYASFTRRTCYEMMGTFNNIILFLILLNTILLTLQTTNLEIKYGWYFSVVDSVLLGVYMAEVLFKWYVYRFLYFRSGWNLFDLLIVATSVISVVLPQVASTTLNGFNTSTFRLLRLFRALRGIRSLRVFRTVKFFRSLQLILETVLQSLPAISNIVLLALIVFYIFVIVVRNLYGKADNYRFGTLARTSFTMFQLITLDNWFDVVTYNPTQQPHLFIVMMFYILIETYTFINLFVAVIVNNLQTAQERLAAERHKIRKQHKRDRDMRAAEAQGDEHNAEASVGNSTMNFQDTKQNATIFDFYGNNLTPKQQELYTMYYQLLASLEYNQSVHQNQSRVLDRLLELGMIDNTPLSIPGGITA